MKPIIEAHHLCKEFLIGANHERYLALRDKLANPFKSLNKDSKQVFKALEDVSFEVMPGDSIGIIGRNGAGKSTLLKILSKITPPTSGKIVCRGRIASLLEVGTGFHPELTGRENVYMNGSILGMRKAEIDKHFDEIVDFSGVEKFLDTPLKRYSSGMQLRLAFAVAAHLEPEILIIDEVLAVGDAEFQKKCLGKMDEVSKSGRTVLFVSHNMGAVINLCKKSILLEKGRLVENGMTKDIIEKYINSDRLNSGHIQGENIRYQQEYSKTKINSIRILSDDIMSGTIKSGKDLIVEVEYAVLEDNISLSISVHLLDVMGTCIFASNNSNSANLIVDPYANKKYQKGEYKTIMTIPENFLNDHNYSISVFIVPDTIYDMTIVPNALSFQVTDTGEMRGEYSGFWMGQIRPKMKWETYKQ